MGKIRPPEQLSRTNYAGNGGQSAFLSFTSVVGIAAAHDRARRTLSRVRPAVASVLPALIKTICHVRHPAAAGFKKRDAQLGKALEHAVDHHAGQLLHLRKRMAQRIYAGE